MTLESKYDTSGTIQAEQHNTLAIIDEAVGVSNFSFRPSFHIVGGTALIFHGLSHEMTIDIDTGNALHNRVRNELGELINDDASTVIIKPKRYMKRLVPYGQDVFDSIDVFLFSIEDLFISKCGTGRQKDIDSIKRSNLYRHCDKTLLHMIMEDELSEDDRRMVENTIKLM